MSRRTGLTSRSGVELRVSWEYDVVITLRLTPKNWSRVQRGLPLRIRGKGYCYEGEFFWDYWDFSGSPANELRVEYGEDGAVGFEGPLASLTTRKLT
jgi:hypothetical protein